MDHACCTTSDAIRIYLSSQNINDYCPSVLSVVTIKPTMPLSTVNKWLRSFSSSDMRMRRPPTCNPRASKERHSYSRNPYRSSRPVGINRLRFCECDSVPIMKSYIYFSRSRKDRTTKVDQISKSKKPSGSWNKPYFSSYQQGNNHTLYICYFWARK